jgi:hypothetical protein
MTIPMDRDPLDRHADRPRCDSHGSGKWVDAEACPGAVSHLIVSACLLKTFKDCMNSQL